MTYIRLNKNANNLEEVTQYYQDRARQLISSGFFWDKKISEVFVFGTPIGVKTKFYKNNKEYVSAYVYEKVRGSKAASKGNYTTIVNPIQDMIVTVPDCDLVDYLKHKSFDFTVAQTIPESTEKAYELISRAYGNTVSKRANIPYMNHIDEGIFILKMLNANDDAIGGWMLHPIFQVPELENVYGEEAKLKLDAAQVMIAMDYARVANAYLSHRKIDNIEQIELSPIAEVNQCLIADKIQNMKDFINYHSDTHPRAIDLYEYFQNWILRLDIPYGFVQNMLKALESIEKED